MRNLFCLVFFLAIGLSLTVAEKNRYDNYKVYRMTVTSEEQLSTLKLLEEQNRYSFWTLPQSLGNVDIMVAPHQMGVFEDLVEELGTETELTIENVQKVFDEENPTGQSRAGVDWQRYNTFDEINSWLTTTVARYPHLLTNINIGQSFEGRPLRVIRLSAKTGNPAIFVEANIHAREWITSATATWLLNELLTSNDHEVHGFATDIDWYFIMVANPDGFVYTHTTDRLWRKTRSGSGICRGTDPNRNFNFHWMQGGASNQACSDTFGGTAAFSEPETRAIANFYASIASKAKIYVSLHAFGQYLLLPYGHTSAQSHNHNALMAIGTSVINAIRQRYNTDYVLGSVANVMYVATGSSADWAFGVHNTQLSYTFELRARRGASNGFVLPATQIIPNSLELFDGLKAMVRHARHLKHL